MMEGMQSKYFGNQIDTVEKEYDKWIQFCSTFLTHFASQLPLLSLTQLKSKTGGKSCHPSLPIGLPLQTFLSPVSKQKSPKIRKECFQQEETRNNIISLIL